MSSQHSQDKENDNASARSGEHSNSDVEEEARNTPVYIPKNPFVRPADVEISEIMTELMKDDKTQENLHRVMGACMDIDNEQNVADHI